MDINMENVRALARKYDVPVGDAPLDGVALLVAIADRAAAPPVKRVLTLGGGVEVDLTDLPPMTIGDRKALKGLGVDFLKYARESRLEPEDEAKLVLYLVQKRRAETTLEEVESVPAMVSSSFLQYFMRRSAEVDDPFSMRSTSSPASTAGALQKSGS